MAPTSLETDISCGYVHPDTFRMFEAEAVKIADTLRALLGKLKTPIAMGM